MDWSIALVARETATTWTFEPQAAEYWPQIPPLRHGDALVLSRFAAT
jgi:hypothetical protein